MSISKKEFQDRAGAILQVCKASVNALSALQASMERTAQLQDLIDHDAFLAKLVADVDACQLEPYKEIVRYLSRKTEN